MTASASTRTQLCASGRYYLLVVNVKTAATTVRVRIADTLLANHLLSHPTPDRIDATPTKGSDRVLLDTINCNLNTLFGFKCENMRLIKK